MILLLVILLLNKKLFYSFSNKFIEDPYTWEKYTDTTPDALPIQGGSVTLANSETNYPEEWKTLKLWVGFSDIPELKYNNDGSFITDFFVDLNVGFNVLNIKNFNYSYILDIEIKIEC